MFFLREIHKSRIAFIAQKNLNVNESYKDSIGSFLQIMDLYGQ